MFIGKLLALTAITGVAAFGGMFTGPASTYYVSDGTTMFQVQGLNVLSSWTVSGLPAAIDTNIRTNGRDDTQPGAQYSLSGTATGTAYTNNTGTSIWDGTTDTVHNYTVSSFNTSYVIQADLDWSNPVVLFNLDASGYAQLGITYDPTNNSLWISDWNAGSSIYNYALDGTLLSQFNAGFGDIGGLALDPADNTLWATRYADTTLFQFSKSGTLLQSGTIAGITSSFLWSGEFSETAGAVPVGAPEPASVVLFAAGAGLLALVRRRRSA